LLLMERAGLALADEAEKMAPTGKIVCVCGGGNNGGDGFVCARILKERKRDVVVVYYATNSSADSRVNMEKWIKAEGVVTCDFPTDCALVVDCLYGTGFTGTLAALDADVVRKINVAHAQGTKVLAADIPSGVDGGNGCVNGEAVRADKTLCIGEIKTGILLGEGIDYAGEIKRVDIGIALPEVDNYATLSERKSVADMLPKRKRASHKGTFGKAAIVAGSSEYTGAAYLAAAACLHAGAGYTTLFAPEKLLPYYYMKSPELLLKPLNGGDRYAFNVYNMLQLKEYDAIAYGMGMGVSEDVARGAVWLLGNYQGKLILDADALNSLARYGKDGLVGLFKTKKCDVLLTPHMKEFSVLSGLDIKEVYNRGLAAPKVFANELGVKVLLKNAVSIITDGRKNVINMAGCSGQAKAGCGDVLSGVIAGLCAMGLSTYEGAIVGAYVTGRAAKLASETIGEYSMTASDVIAYLGRSFLQLQ